MKHSSSKLASLGKLRWLWANLDYPLQLLIYLGYDAIDMAAAYGSGACTNYGEEGFDFRLYERLIPTSIKDWAPEVESNRCAPLHYTERFSFIESVVDDSILPQATMKPNELMHWLMGEMACLRLRGDRWSHLFVDPAQLIQYGYRLARVAGRRNPMNSTPFAAALCMVGLGSIANPGSGVCQHCFRVTPTGLASCNLHSQSKFILDDDYRSRSRQSHSARVGRRAKQLLNWPSEFPNYLCRYPGGHVKEDVTAGMFWPLSKEKHGAWNQRVAEALQKAPLVDQLLPKDFLRLPNREQLALLRATLDENEWVINCWPRKIQVAQQWFETEAAIIRTPDKGGLSKTNAERLRQVDAFLATGMKKSEIAERLGISRSHLSQLLRRRKLKPGA